MQLTSFMPVKLITGPGCVRSAAKELGKLGTKALIVTGKNAARACGALQDVIDALEESRQGWILFDGIGQNPALTDCMDAAKEANAAGADFVIGIGGGSALDAAKCIAVLAANPGMTQQQLYAFDWPKAPLNIAVVGTTAGTGSEVTKVSVITTPEGRKKSFHHEAIFPRLALGDPTYTMTLPPLLQLPRWSMCLLTARRASSAAQPIICRRAMPWKGSGCCFRFSGCWKKRDSRISATM